MLSRQGHRDRAFLEGAGGLLRRRRPVRGGLIQVVLPESLRPRLLQLAHYAIVADHPGLNRMYYHIRRHYYWPHLTAEIAATVRNCASCAIKLRRRTNLLKLFPATRPLESVSIDILGSLPKSERGKRFLLVITDRFTKLTTVVPLRNGLRVLRSLYLGLSGFRGYRPIILNVAILNAAILSIIDLQRLPPLDTPILGMFSLKPRN